MPPSSTDESAPGHAPRNDREVYRAVYPVGYPISLTPHVLLDGEALATPLLDCSEHGIRYHATSGEAPPLGTPVTGEIRTPERPPRSFRGHVVRAAPDEVALRLDHPGLPFSMLLAEQRAVLVWARSRAIPG
ncbi:MAG: PilZ domain-containing protein [bacterium]